MEQKEFENILNDQRLNRDKIQRSILSSCSPRKIIVSGPGTGKTFTFKELLKTKNGNCLALTFINNLARKLKIDIGNLAKTCTFHSFCKEMLHKAALDDLSCNFILFPQLDILIHSDATVLYNLNINFPKSFQDIDLSNNNISFFLKRSSYYDAVSFDDSVYRVMEYFKYNPEKMPKYEQIVVDEYQDFNKLEVEFLNILSENSPVLIVGDDDQALYGMLKNASAKYIREKFNDPSYEKFCLPYCGRCTIVITDAVQDIITQSKKAGKLKERINKEYNCYLPDKLADSNLYPSISHVQCTVQSTKVPYIARFIEKAIDAIPSEEVQSANEKADYTVLVAGSGHYLRQVQDYFRKLDKYRIIFRKEEAYDNRLSIIDGYRILLENGESANLGWRILINIDKPDKMKEILEKTHTDSSVSLVNILPKNYINRHLSTLGLLRRALEGNELAKTEENQLETILKDKISNITKYFALATAAAVTREPDNAKAISMVFSTYVGCKGLSAGFVFIIGLDEGSLPKHNSLPSEIEIRNFIVALTRTVKKCYLVSTLFFSGKKVQHSRFIDWIDSKRLDVIKVNKTYFS